MLGPIGMPELLIILVIILIIFGVGKLPEIGSAIGKGIKNFKKSMNEKEITDETVNKEKDKK
ncbi:MAG TPA: twin-arginine translocase TatA/TatE family subunit [Smithellaceae bacterium]|jgi:sec-independent protein translocase protein TatA|nr:twin-arginine translocase TatA/TatE family subunit [Syntrophaceae bacterium]NMD04655.1 twin-arginine translocase TatA/TatE family subunit [Deltaproteobacteria bacterium]OPZ54014.1 MAG: Sec-independent protein translocase protein TatA [Deltaproteobacteria bacterium ADurb.BinA014]HNQ17608.1 twin-arginine translocase TatA/TatE family subunit [Smithellaceae bacterium]MBP8609604.1 twin-arginine translocase TatA/TatE family subunit [Syntrophaceae bacterium]